MIQESRGINSCMSTCYTQARCIVFPMERVGKGNGSALAEFSSCAPQALRTSLILSRHPEVQAHSTSRQKQDVSRNRRRGPHICKLASMLCQLHLLITFVNHIDLFILLNVSANLGTFRTRRQVSSYFEADTIRESLIRRRIQVCFENFELL